MAYDERLADRVRDILAARRPVVERKMMGGICFMVDGNMCCGVSRAALMVRVGRDAYSKTLSLSHVRPLEFGGRRPIGYVLIDPAGYRSAVLLNRWIDRGLAFVATLPPKKERIT